MTVPRPAGVFRLPPTGGARPRLPRSVLTLTALLLVLVGGIEIIRPGTVSLNWLSNTLLFAAPLGIFAAGQTLVMLTGGIDLSLASVATGAAYLLATNATHLGSGAALLLALGLGSAVGVLNAIGVALLRVQPLVMTLGTGLMTLGILVVYSQQVIGSEPRVPEFIQALGSGKVLGFLPVAMFLWVPIAAAMIFVLRQTGFGRLLYAIGDNPLACRLAGIRTWHALFAAYVACGVLNAVAGLVLVGSTNAADLGLAEVYLLPSIAAVIIGGTSIFGGRGGYAGSIVGALILTILQSLLTLLDATEPMKQIFYGVVILVLATAYSRLTE